MDLCPSCDAKRALLLGISHELRTPLASLTTDENGLVKIGGVPQIPGGTPTLNYDADNETVASWSLKEA